MKIFALCTVISVHTVYTCIFSHFTGNMTSMVGLFTSRNIKAQMFRSQQFIKSALAMMLARPSLFAKPRGDTSVWRDSLPVCCCGVNTSAWLTLDKIMEENMQHKHEDREDKVFQHLLSSNEVEYRASATKYRPHHVHTFSQVSWKTVCAWTRCLSVQSSYCCLCHFNTSDQLFVYIFPFCKCHWDFILRVKLLVWAVFAIK